MLDNIKKFAEGLDQLRIFPRIFISVYMYLLYDSVTWFMALPAPSMEQAVSITVMTGVGAAWFAQYVSTGNRKKEEK